MIRRIAIDLPGKILKLTTQALIGSELLFCGLGKCIIKSNQMLLVTYT